jgi:predicted Rdx family selenoprotein
VSVNGSLLFSKKAEGRYPEIKELKEAINTLLD